MFAGIIAALKALPELIALAKAALNGILELVELHKINALKQRELIAAQKALATGDTSDLEAIFRGEK